MIFLNFLVLLGTLNFVPLWACDAAASSEAVADTDVALRGPVTGKVISADDRVYGAVFATPEDAREAKRRGAEDARNPFVSLVGCIVFRTGETSGIKAVVTIMGVRDDQALLVGCRHTFDALRDALHWNEGKARESVRIHFGEHSLEGFSGDLGFRYKADVDVALATIKMTKGHWPEGPYLPFAERVATHSAAPALAVSYSAIGCVGRDDSSSIDAGVDHRALSYHILRPSGRADGKLNSLLEGKLADDIAVRGLALTMTGRPHDAKVLYQSSEIDFPAPTKPVDSLRAAFGFGSSGTPAVVKMGGVYCLAAILNSGAAMPRAVFENSGGSIVLKPETFSRTVWVNRFEDLSTPDMRSWLLAEMAKLGF